MPKTPHTQTNQPDAIVGLMRYMPEFRGQPDENIKGYLYRLFNDSTFGAPEQRQQWQNNLLSKVYGATQNVRSRNPNLVRDIPSDPKEFAQSLREGSVAYKPIPEWQKYGKLEVPQTGTPFNKMTTEEKRYQRVIGELEQKYPGFGKELFYGVQTIKNLIGKHIAPLIAMTAAPGAPDWHKNWAMRRVEGLTPELDFSRQITRDYGHVAGFAYSFAEALPGIATSVGASRAALGILGATKLPLASAASRSLLASPVAFNTAFWGGYSAGAYNQTMYEQKKDPTRGGYAINLAAGGAVGRLFPNAKKLLNTKKGAEWFVRESLAPSLERSVADLKRLGRGQLVDEMRAKLFKPHEIQRGLNAVRYSKAPTKSLVRDYFLQSTGAGAMGAATGAVGSLTAGLPIDLPSLVHNGLFMMAFHAWGPIGEKIGPRAKPVEKVSLPDKTLKIGERGHRELLLNALEMPIRKPDTPMDRWLPDFARRLKEAGVEKVEVAEGDVRNVDSFVQDFQKHTSTDAYKDALKKYSKAASQFEIDPANSLRQEMEARAELDNIVSVISRRAGQNPNDITSGIKAVADKNVGNIEKKASAGEKQEAILRDIEKLTTLSDEIPPPRVAPKLEITNAMRAEIAKKWAMKPEQVTDEFARMLKQPIKSKEHYIELSEEFQAGYKERLGLPIGEKGYVRLYEVKKGKKAYLLEEVGGGKYNVFEVGKPAGEKFNKALEPMSSYRADEIEGALKIKVPTTEAKEVSAADVMAAEFEKLKAQKAAEAEKPKPTLPKEKPPAKSEKITTKDQAFSVIHSKSADRAERFKTMTPGETTRVLQAIHDTVKDLKRYRGNITKKSSDAEIANRIEPLLNQIPEDRFSTPPLKKLVEQIRLTMKSKGRRQSVKSAKAQNYAERMRRQRMAAEKEIPGGAKEEFHAQRRADIDRMKKAIEDKDYKILDEAFDYPVAEKRTRHAKEMNEVYERARNLTKEHENRVANEEVDAIYKLVESGKAEEAIKRFDALDAKLEFGSKLDKRLSSEVRNRIGELGEALKFAEKPVVKDVKLNVPKKDAAVLKLDVDWMRMDAVNEPHVVNDGFFRKHAMDAAKRFGVKTENANPDQIRFAVRQKIRDRVYAATREKRDYPVSFIDRAGNRNFGFIMDIVRTADDVKYKIRPYFGDRKPVEVSWLNIDRSGESLRPYARQVEETLHKMGLSPAKINEIMSGVLDGGAKLYGGAGAFEWIGKIIRQHLLAGKERVRQEAILKAGFPERIAATARAMREARDTKDSLLMHLARVLVYGPPKSVATPTQWQMIKNAIKYNRTNPHAIEPMKFIKAIVGRTDFEPGVGGHKPLTRGEARQVLQAYAQVSEAIRDHNWLLAMNVFLPSELKRYNPRINLAWDNMNKMEHRLNGMNVDGNKILEQFTAWGLRDGSGVNPLTLTPEFQKYAARAYKEGKLYEAWLDGRTIGDEVSGILHGIISKRDRFVSQLAKRCANEIVKSGFREKWWWWFNRAVDQRLRMWSGRMFKDKDAFIKSYTKWKMEDKKTTPENADAMFEKFSAEAADIHGNKERLKTVIDEMVDSKRLGKIVDAEQKNAYYPRFYENHPQRLLEQLEGLERGELPTGRIGEFLSPHATRRKLDRIQGLKLQKADPVKDFASYMRNVSTFIWRNDVAFQLWAAKKGIMRDIYKSPQHARVFQHHIEIVNKLRGDILDYTDKFIDNVSLGLGNLSAAVFLAHPGTVARNFVGGHMLTAVYNGFGWFSRAWKFRQSEEGQRVLKELGFELSSHWGFEQHQTRGQLAREMNMKPGPKALSTMNEFTRTITSYALSHPIPFVADMVPGVSNFLKRFSFTGSEIHLRQVAFLAGYLRAKEAVMSGDRLLKHKSRIVGDTMEQLSAKAKKKKITDYDERDVRLVKLKSDKEQYQYNYMTRETDADLTKRANRAGMDGGLNSIVMTQFVYSRLNLPTVMRHPLGRLLLLFKRYTWNRVAFMNRAFKEAMPGAGGGPEELARLFRFAAMMSTAMTLSSLVNINLYRWVEDDVVSMWGEIVDWMKTGEIKPYGKSFEQYLSGAFFSRLYDSIEAFQEGDDNWMRQVAKAPVTPYGRYIDGILREQEKIASGRKSVFDSILNQLGVYYYNYDGGGRRERSGRRGR